MASQIKRQGSNPGPKKLVLPFPHGPSSYVSLMISTPLEYRSCIIKKIPVSLFNKRQKMHFPGIYRVIKTRARTRKTTETQVAGGKSFLLLKYMASVRL